MRKITFKTLFFIFPLLLLSCAELEFYGDTFYTVQGQIVDADNQAIPNIPLYVSSTPSSFEVSGKGKTDQNGAFQITFPKSNMRYFLILQEDYEIIDSINVDAYETNSVELKTLNFRNYLLNLEPIKTVKK